MRPPSCKRQHDMTFSFLVQPRNHNLSIVHRWNAIVRSKWPFSSFLYWVRPSRFAGPMQSRVSFHLLVFMISSRQPQHNFDQNKKKNRPCIKCGSPEYGSPVMSWARTPFDSARSIPLGSGSGLYVFICSSKWAPNGGGTDRNGTERMCWHGNQRDNREMAWPSIFVWPRSWPFTTIFMILPEKKRKKLLNTAMQNGYGSKQCAVHLHFIAHKSLECSA